MNDRWRGLQLPEERFAVTVGDPGVDRGRADALMPEVVLDELEGHTGIEKVGRD